MLKEEPQETRQRRVLLYDFYGELLTGKQRACYEAYYQEDLTFAEIGGQNGVTPQAVADMLKRTSALLERYESVLKLAEKHQRQRILSEEAERCLDRINEARHRERVAAIRAGIRAMQS